MNLLSGNPLIKRSNHSSSEQGGEDIISKLPEALLIHILSLLPEPFDAIRTCILSKRWKRLWVFLPNLYFVLPDSLQSAEQVKTFHDSVDNALALRGGMFVIRRFFLSCSKNYDHDRLLNFLSIVVQNKIDILDLKFRPKSKLRLSWDFLKACSTLVELTLKGVCVLDDVDQAEFLFPCLKKVNLLSVEYSGDQSPQNLISHCPVLQELCLESQITLSVETKIISSPYLKRLRIVHCKFGPEVLIDAPRLEYLYIEEVYWIDTKYSLKNPLSRVEAHIDRFSDTVVELLTCVSDAKGLSLSYRCLCAIRSFYKNNAPIFPNLVKLDVHIKVGWWHLWSLLFDLLKNMPLLEQFTVLYGHEDEHLSIDGWILPAEAPTCLRFKMKEIIILNEQVVTHNLLIVIHYLLRHSTVLERLTLNAHNIHHERHEQLLNLYRGSSICRIELV